MTSAEEFVEFVEDAFPRLRRTAFLLCGDWHTAEDLAQTALAKMFVSWRKIERPDAADAYASRTLVNTYRTHMRLKRTGELLTGRLPEPSVQAPEIGGTDDGARCPGGSSASGPDGCGAALLGGPERRAGGRHAGLLDGQREEPQRPRPGEAAATAGRGAG